MALPVRMQAQGDESAGGRDDPHRWLARSALVVLLLAFVAQSAVREVWAEPYPGLFQPAFGGTPPPGHVVEVTEPFVRVAYTDGSRAVFSHRQVMSEARVLPVAVFNSAFFPGSPRAADERNHEWLRARVSELGDGRAIQSLDVDWTTTTYDMAGRRPPESVVSQHVGMSVGENR